MEDRVITEDDIKQRIDGEMSEAIGWADEISQQRAEAMSYYYGEPMGNEVDGRSQFVDSTVQDSIEWIKPALMRVFASGDELVQFQPSGPEDVAAAQQATDYVNFVLQRQNDGWQILYNWFTDALLQKNGIVKVWWEESEKYQRETYKGLSDVEFDSIFMDENVEVVEHEEISDAMGMPMHNVVIRRYMNDGKVSIVNVPPEEFVINREAKSIQEARFVCHRVRKTLSELREMYPDMDESNIGDGDYTANWDIEHAARFINDNTGDPYYIRNNAANEDALKEYWLYESFLRTDFDGDGITELRKVCTVGNEILSNEEVDNIPFISITPIKVPHKFFGLSIADLTIPLQQIKSVVTRNLLDNMYNQNYGRFAVLEGQANLDDLLSARPGGIVRVKSPNAVMPLATPTLEPYTFQMLEYIDGIRESRAGVSRNSQGLNDKALTSHTTAAAVNAVMTAAQSRVELIARQFAETGVKELMLRIYELLCKYMDKKRVFRLRNEWIEIDPTSWNDSMDATVSVALGQGNKDQQVAQLMQLVQMAGSQAGNPMVSAENNYNLMAALIKSMGYQNVDDYITPPDRQQPPGPDPMMEAQLQSMQIDDQVKQGELEVKRMKVQNEMKETQLDAKFKMVEMEMEADRNAPVKIG
jgi:hypothetical protein